jgi:multidrug efflux pump subunit AcrA (membrane-fusion protein)
MAMTGTFRVGQVARCGFALGIVAIALVGCKGEPPPAPPPPEVSVIEVKPDPVTVYEEYVAQTQAPNNIAIGRNVTGLLKSQNFADGACIKKGDLRVSSFVRKNPFFWSEICIVSNVPR